MDITLDKGLIFQIDLEKAPEINNKIFFEEKRFASPELPVKSHLKQIRERVEQLETLPSPSHPITIATFFLLGIGLSVAATIMA